MTGVEILFPPNAPTLVIYQKLPVFDHDGSLIARGDQAWVLVVCQRCRIPVRDVDTIPHTNWHSALDSAATTTTRTTGLASPTHAETAECWTCGTTPDVCREQSMTTGSRCCMTCNHTVPGRPPQ